MTEAEAARGVERRILLVGVGVLIAACLVVRLVVAVLTATLPFEVFLRIQASGRVHQALRHLPEVAARKDAALFLGASTTMQQLFPEVFDRALEDGGIKLTSYNFAIPLCAPTFVELFADRFHRAHGRAQLAIVELVVGLGIKDPNDGGRQARLHAMNKAQVAQLIDLPRVLWRSPETATNVLGSLVVGGYQPTFLKDVAGVLLFDSPPVRPVLQREIDLVRGETARTGVPAEEWSTARRGGMLVPPEGDPARDAVLDAVGPLPWRKEQIRHNAAKMQWDPALDPVEVESFYAALRKLARDAEHVIVLLPPIHPTVYATQRSDRLRRYEGYVERARKEGAQIIDLSHEAEFGDAAFYDATHLKLRAGERYSRLVAERVAALLTTAEAR